MANDTGNKDAENRDTGDRLQAHFWITATTLAVHAFLMSETSQETNTALVIKVVGTIVWLLAIYNIVEIAGSSDVKAPESRTDKLYWSKFWQTIGNWQVLYKRMWFVLLEFKGAFFYCTLIFLSFVGVLSVSGTRRPVIEALLWLFGVFVFSWFLDRTLKKPRLGRNN